MKEYSTPHPKNFCGCGYPDWLEVNLTSQCNGRCSWCVERRGWHPRNKADWATIVQAAIDTGRQNIILLGGEPTLHPDIGKIVEHIRKAGRNPWITTNGSLLSSKWVLDNLVGIEGINISIHHYDLSKNEKITGIQLQEDVLQDAISSIHILGKSVRLNCNCIRSYIDSETEVHQYIEWAKKISADNVRFAELKFSDEEFVDLANILDHKHGTNDDPYHKGCTIDTEINGMQVNFRQMCGMQTSKRPCPTMPKIMSHQVLYYDGQIYDGWQQKGEKNMTNKELKALLELVAKGKIHINDAANLIKTDPDIPAKDPGTVVSGGSCHY